MKKKSEMIPLSMREKSTLEERKEEDTEELFCVMDDRWTIPDELPPVTEEDEKFFEQIIKELHL